MADSIPFNKYVGIVTNEKLAEAYGAWIRNEVPDAKVLGDVVIAQSFADNVSTEIDLEADEDAALVEELATFEALLEAPRPTPYHTAPSGVSE